MDTHQNIRETGLQLESDPENSERSWVKSKRNWISLGEGLNNIPQDNSEEDVFNTESLVEQQSFLHSKYASSISNLNQIDANSEKLEHEIKKKKKKRSVISRGLIELINLRELGSSGDTNIRPNENSSPTTTASGHSGEDDLLVASCNMKKSVTIPIDLSSHQSAPSQGSSNNGDNSDPSPPQSLQVRKKKLSTSPRRKEKGKSAPEPESIQRKSVRNRSRAVSEMKEEADTHPRTFVTPATPPTPAPPLPEGRTMLDCKVNLAADKLFELIFSESQFFKNWLFDPKTGVKINNLKTTKWSLNPETNQTEREVVYERYQNFGFTTATITVAGKQTQLQWSQPGSVWGVEIKTTNSGALYADSFVSTEQFRISATGPETSHFVIVASIEFVVRTWIKGKIESEYWSGSSKLLRILEDNVKNINKVQKEETESSDNKNMVVEKKEHEKKIVKEEKRIRPARQQFTPDNNQSSDRPMMVGMLVLIILTLLMMILLMYKLCFILETIDQRLANIEKIFYMKS